MNKNVTQLKCLVNNKEHVFTCDMDCSTIEVKEALYQFLKYIGQIEDHHAAKLKEEQDSKVEIEEESKAEIIEV